MKATVYKWISVEEIEDIAVKVEVDMYYDGIGHYEAWGSAGYDRGYPTCDIESVTWDKREYTPEQNRMIEEFIEEWIEDDKVLSEINEEAWS